MSSNIQIEKVCQWCEKNFIARTTQTAYCSKRCAEHAYKDRKRKEKMERFKEEVRRVQTGLKEIDEKELLTPRQAAQYLGLCYKTFYIYINKGVIKAWKLNLEDSFNSTPWQQTFEFNSKDSGDDGGKTPSIINPVNPGTITPIGL